ESSGTMKDRKQAALQRLARLEGQVRGVIRMVAEDRNCVDILNQTLAIRSALAQVEVLILQDHADDCVDAAIASSDPEAQRQKFRELVGIFEKVCR
ncbi:metal-sensitive transcriptional regulator, partial [Hoeflea sp.]|uniref:metal-sensitive transcriptional regulator n=1 Tax=Hoeflea sp. TaxID=1940281 RepID=UPI0031B81D8B